jgi:hypothetical protein
MVLGDPHRIEPQRLGHDQVLDFLADEDAAYAELDRRYVAGEGGPGAAVFATWVDAFDRHDWEAFRGILHPEIVDEDCRRFSVRGPMHGAAASAHGTQALFDLSPDLRVRILHIRGGDGTFLYQNDWRGTQKGADDCPIFA